MISQNPILSKEADQKLVFNLSKNSLPTWTQLKTAPKFFSDKEKKLVKLLTAAIALCIILLAINFYFAHSVLIPKVGGAYTVMRFETIRR